MTHTDAGPLIALIDADEADHDVCRRALSWLPMPLVTTLPAFTEAMYLVTRAGGRRGQQALWSMWSGGNLEIAELSHKVLQRSEELMGKYADLPMDLAGATLVALAEERREQRVFTLDRDFVVYRINDRQRFEIVPG